MDTVQASAPASAVFVSPRFGRRGYFVDGELHIDAIDMRNLLVLLGNAKLWPRPRGRGCEAPRMATASGAASNVARCA